MEDRLLAMYLPVAPDLVLCGLSPGVAPEPDALPEAIARCSMDYFVAHEQSDQFNTLQPRIGELAYLLDDAGVENLLAEVFGE